ncbi:MAG: hypothetical protein COX39_03000 [Candidatus Nealsonbacteria bacterium CG23_combo_of_CG06-09_8_20_14_all_40_13]|uniref:UDP-N-acetylmuramoyl-tripeptide--D-alanyl-D-alanine ligase n=1 Tax=Candidatus Nealsonbacteria bacterium CG23_combo_of_CG06-09_8_20_14_all_40_13 TaxID=1974724 RepID=A0A2G9YQB7_9BACT|nr:MAG: hypothetical protein COX39_03000 [Candidatus Nealsonbacteria bacterium CG23_combo_of_CG06-09_8_20_14_all_40_13]PIR71348.1 MAG: hypothetical protein COU44_00045 [Candidatus Nealsonbacteria bacterium CG10_big_fil_rev_8_21_14_0_10_40_24]PIU43210.1 MAG: hypothetical protein COS97_02310 [Candidatus Nealsonbacteria bacterium CG07_land_8_20_14_0_80_40_10]
MKKILLKILQAILRMYASALLKLKKPTIVAVTGSAGKTSTKEALFEVLKIKFKKNISKSYGNLNNEIGLPLAVFHFKRTYSGLEYSAVICWIFLKFSLYVLKILPYPKVLVLEMAADKIGDMAYLTTFVKPKVSVITNIASAHLESFQTLENVAKEKRKILEVLPKDGLAVVSRNDVENYQLGSRTQAQVKLFGEDNAQEEICQIVGEYFGIKRGDIEKTLTQIKPLAGRLNLISGKNDSWILDDTYNANPASTIYALQNLQKQASRLKAERKIVLLGDMLELGKDAIALHQQIGEQIRQQADIFVAVGEAVKAAKPDFCFSNPLLAAEFLLKKIQRKDIILIKGSQGMRMEQAVEKLMANPKQAQEILVRQSASWKAKPLVKA